ncbi:MAG TPA: AAA family ATPase [Gemmatimonadaceae bacterium]|nr:AAA family ATPase [Gemmatimonadaceae bacterium]
MLRSEDATLQQVTRDLTALARAGKLEPVRCREMEISRVMDILLRHQKNNPALVGAAGVGKTAIAEGLAQRIADGTVPLALRSARILALDHVSLLAGTMFRGQYEERLRAVVAAASADPDVILFVDELHNLIGQGTAIGVAMDAANMLKPALVRGEFRVIGATTDDEYDRWVRGDPALERRFQPIPVRELSAEETLQILRARLDRLERHHSVAISEEALVASVELTDRYVSDRVRPDRAIDVLDEACAHAQATASYSRDLERLILERRALVGAAERARTTVEEPEQVKQGTAEAASASSTEPEEDPIGRMARDGFAALERFGLELEAALSNNFARPAAQGPADASDDGAARRQRPAPNADTEAARTREREPRASRAPGKGERLAALEAELRRRLIEEGLVVRGHDVARVVAVSTGQHVHWSI